MNEILRFMQKRDERTDPMDARTEGVLSFPDHGLWPQVGDNTACVLSPLFLDETIYLYNIPLC